MILKPFFLILISLIFISCNSDTFVEPIQDLQSTNVQKCPSGFVPVLHNSSSGTISDFCVSKFEMKLVAGKAVSQPAGSPWTNILISEAKTACNDLGSGYDLISNSEWMTIALDLEKVASNWSTGIVGTGYIFRGHSDNSPASVIPVDDESFDYSNTGNSASSGLDQKRTLTLSNGSVIWDFSGNADEWVDWGVQSGLDLAPRSCRTFGWQELPSVNCPAFVFADYVPGNPGLIASASYNASYGLGRFFGGNNPGGAAVRGGHYGRGSDTGIFSLDISRWDGVRGSGIGFRCVFRP